MTADLRFSLSFLVFCCCILFLPPRQAVGDETKCWTRYLGGPGSIITDLLSSRQGIWATGRMTEDGSTPDLWIALFDENGQILWQLRLPAKGYQLYPRLAANQESVRVIAEILSPSVPVAGGGSLPASQVWVGTVTREGRFVGQRTFAPHRVTTVQAVAALPDGGVLLVGLAETGSDTSNKGWLARLDRDGQLAWQQLLPQVSWLTSLSEIDVDQWLIAGTAHEKEENSPRPWLAAVDRTGRILKSWEPEITDFSLNDALATPSHLWLAGEGTMTQNSARLFLVDRQGTKVSDYPVAGLSVLRLLSISPNGPLAGGDGIGDRQPTEQESAPGWLHLPQERMKDAPNIQKSLKSLVIHRWHDVPFSEVHALSIYPAEQLRSSQSLLIGAGAHPDRGAWIGCNKIE